MKQLTELELKKLDEAEDYYFDALETNDLEKQDELLEKCLTLNPDHLDAKILLIVNDYPPYFAVEELQKLERAEKRKLKKEDLYEPGRMYGIFETRPYMRCLLHIAQSACDAGMYKIALKYYELILKLNPNDNMGVRYVIPGLYLYYDKRKPLEQLIDFYQEVATEMEIALAFMWIKEGDFEPGINYLLDIYDTNDFYKKLLEKIVNEDSDLDADETNFLRTFGMVFASNPIYEHYLTIPYFLKKK